MTTSLAPGSSLSLPADTARPVATPRKLGKVRPVSPDVRGHRSVHCNLCQRKLFSGLLLAHMQQSHGDAVYSRTATGRPKNLWFRLPPPSPAPAWRRPAALHSVFSRQPRGPLTVYPACR